jgi:hypothetical protein
MFARKVSIPASAPPPGRSGRSQPSCRCAVRDIPSLDEPEGFVDQPPAAAGSGTASSPVTGKTDSCAQPLDMQKRTSGAFLGGLSMDSYYPYLAGKGSYAHPDSAGPFDTGAKAGANVQLFGVIPSPCDPGQYSLAQTVAKPRFRINGVTQPQEGGPVDDIAKSHQNASAAPFRQEFLGGGGAPLGYLISMADPPSIPYGADDTIEFDRDFTTSLVGPGGRKTVAWSLSTRITKGKVTRNDLT